MRFSEKGDKEQENEISIDVRLKLKIARKIFRSDLALSAFELQRGVQRMIEFFHKRDERPDIAIAQAGARIVLLELFDQPARIINADIELIVGMPQKSAREFAQFPRRCARQPRQLRATGPIDQAILQIDSDLRVGPFEEALDLAEERFVHKGARDELFVQVQQRIGKPIQREPDFAKSVRQSFKNVINSQRRAVACEATS